MKQITVKEILEVINRIDSINATPDKTSDDLAAAGMDSLSFIQMVVELEAEFECEIPDEYLLITELNTVDKIYTLLETLHANNA